MLWLNHVNIKCSVLENHQYLPNNWNFVPFLIAIWYWSQNISRIIVIIVLNIFFLVRYNFVQAIKWITIQFDRFILKDLAPNICWKIKNLKSTCEINAGTRHKTQFQIIETHLTIQWPKWQVSMYMISPRLVDRVFRLTWEHGAPAWKIS